VRALWKKKNAGLGMIEDQVKIAGNPIRVSNAEAAKTGDLGKIARYPLEFPLKR
jgi:hypothetical protein